MRHPVGDAPGGQAPDALPPAWGFRVVGWAGTAGGIKNDLTKTSPLRIGADPSTRMSSDSRFLCRNFLLDVEQCFYCIFLLFADDEVANEVAGIVL